MNEAAIDALLGTLSSIGSLPASIAALVALLKEARANKREISKQELDALCADDDFLSSQLDAAIAAAGGTR